ncbi:hypothetical protein O997_04745 [Anaplasma phagocytophilum str. MRK]|nr:hypothetical protein O997_04745 [Anaplasma phagocytophilum str. MRK]
MYVSHALEMYFLLFVDSFVASLILPISKMSAFSIMCCFGGYSATISVFIGALGASVGGIVNWCLGRLILLARMGYHKSQFPQTLHSYLRVFLVLLLGAFSWVHLVGAIINVICGCFKVRLSYTYCAVFLSYLAYLLYYLTHNGCAFN